jgi:D-alanyl-D-alanine dipeptidase
MHFRSATAVSAALSEKYSGCRAAVAMACLALVWAFAGAGGASAQDLPGSLVYLRAIAPEILQDMRYAGADNFTGRPVPGYGAAECILTRPAAEALARVQKELAARKLTLKVFDCYRPLRAVRAFMSWADDPNSSPPTKFFYPRLEKRQLVGLGYIARHSIHSRGTAVDLTIAEPGESGKGESGGRTARGSCTDPAGLRGTRDEVDMGTSFDCFDVRSHTRASGLTADQRRWRQTLVDAMARQGFLNYWREWWHFTYEPSGGGPAFDVPIVAQTTGAKH